MRKQVGKKIAGLVCLIILCINGFGQVNKPVKNFEAFWQLLDQNYASFEEKQIDWNQTYQEYRPKVSSTTTDEKLFDLFSQMVAPFNDAHLVLKAKNIDKTFSASRKSRIKEELSNVENLGTEFRCMTETTLYRNGFDPIKQIGPEFRNKKLFSYTTNGTIGYLRFFRSFSTLVNMNGFLLNNQLNQIFKEFSSVNSLIIDVRFNMGGTDEFSQKVAGRFVEKKAVGFLKQTRKNAVFGDLEERYIKPTRKEPFAKQVVLITNDRTVSAADVFAIMMAEIPNVTIIGEPTNGSYSDIYSRKLPNGWRVNLSNQRYFSVGMMNYEGRGTPVDIDVKNMLADVIDKEDRVLLKAIDLLKL
jgi:carboxyl-terminal processing protease